MKTKVVFLWCLLLSTSLAYSQNLTYVKGIIDTLTMPGFYGRGYVNNGNKIASEFISKQLQKNNIQKFDTSYFQRFNINVNTFPGKVELKINDTDIKPGLDFIVSPDAQSMNKTYKTLVLNEKTLNSPKQIKKFNKTNLLNIALVIDTGFKDLKNPKIKKAPLVLFIRDHGLTWSVAQEQTENKHDEIFITRNALPQEIKNVSVNIEAKQCYNYQTQNIAGYIPGIAFPDSFLVFTAHYDHLGMMGTKAYFPGANDNASGTAMVLDLASFYSMPANRSDYSVVFILFTGEEAGLLGSEYFTEHPLFPLKKIKFLLNLDMVGTGSDGIKVVNGSIFKKEFEKLKQLNEEGKYLKSINERGEAANSDHYFFYKKGVKCFFIYTLGNEYKEYHNVNDKSQGLPLTKYPELFKLITSFARSL